MSIKYLLLLACIVMSAANAFTQTSEWVKQNFGPSDAYAPSSILTDKDGNVYCLGHIKDPFVQGLFITKYDPSGMAQWSHVIPGKIEGEDLAISNNGNIYVTGNFAGIIKTNETTFESKGESDLFTAKLDNKGVKWIHTFGGPGSDTGKDIMIINERIYITGSFKGTISFKHEHLGKEGGNFFLGCYDSSGKPLWITSANGNSGDCMGLKLESDALGNIYVLGTMDHSIQFKEQMQPDFFIRAHQGTFLAKYKATGSLEWVKKTSEYYGNTAGISTGKTGNIYVAGTSGRYPSTPWIKEYNSSGDLVGYQEFTEPSIYGSGSEAILVTEKEDLYYAHHTALFKKGNWIISSKQFYCKALITDRYDNVYVLGSVPPSSSGPIVIGDTTFTPGKNSSFLAKITK